MKLSYLFIHCSPSKCCSKNLGMVEWRPWQFELLLWNPLRIVLQGKVHGETIYSQTLGSSFKTLAKGKYIVKKPRPCLEINIKISDIHVICRFFGWITYTYILDTKNKHIYIYTSTSQNTWNLLKTGTLVPFGGPTKILTIIWISCVRFMEEIIPPPRYVFTLVFFFQNSRNLSLWGICEFGATNYLKTLVFTRVFTL